MKEYGKLYNDLNTLISFLNATNVVKLVNDFYAQYGNTAPAMLLQEQIDKIQNYLNEAK